MILKKAQRFENIIKNPVTQGPNAKKYVTWDDPVQIERFTKEINAEARDLMTENRRLRRVHTKIID